MFLTNHNSASPIATLNSIGRLTPAAAATTPDPPSAQFSLFVSERDGETLRLIANNGELRIPGLRAALIPLAGDRFRNPSGDLFFMSQDEFELKSMEGQTTRYRRAQPFAPARGGDSACPRSLNRFTSAPSLRPRSLSQADADARRGRRLPHSSAGR